ncbi:MAG: hypothetical protein KF763_14555 [Cyclobacteriaceae bacterium]|nr:hypothetical protein [Cyclobacteriaceae bacterium]
MRKLLKFYYDFGAIQFSQNKIADLLGHLLIGVVIGVIISLVKGDHYVRTIILFGSATTLLGLMNQRLRSLQKTEE